MSFKISPEMKNKVNRLGWVFRKHAGFAPAGEGEVLRKPPEPFKRFSSTLSLLSSSIKECKVVPNFIHYLKVYFWLLIIICPLLFPRQSFTEIIDRIAAVVNDKVITLTDLKIVKEFGLYDQEAGESNQSLDRLILEKMVDQKLVVQLAGEQVSAGKEELDSFLKKLTEEMGSEKLRRRLEEFGMDLDALKGYVEERVKYQKIILQRFGQGNIVSLKEMEDYYQRVYVPSQQKKGLEIRPMMDILAEIELSIKQEKIKAQVEDWIKSLRKRADIQVQYEGNSSREKGMSLS
jgi:hypothetical protein